MCVCKARYCVYESASILLWENEFCICERDSPATYNNWWETETNRIAFCSCGDCGQLKRRRQERKTHKKNSKHVFALIVFNKQHLNVNYCDYFVWCAEVNYFSLLVMWRFIYSHTKTKQCCSETWKRKKKHKIAEVLSFG